jgi:hypothetical protein
MKRQIGVIFIILALIIQSFAVLFPPESANAGNTADFMEGGFSTIDEYLNYYDQDTLGIKDLLTSLGISRADIQAAHIGTLEAAPHLVLWKMTSRGDSDDDTAYGFLKSDGTTKTVYNQPLSLKNAPPGPSHAAYIGSSSSGGWFALLKNSGNLVTKAITPLNCASQPAVPAGTPVPVSLQDIKQCGIKLTPTLTARNLTTGTPATFQKARASDHIMYTLAVKNNDSRTVSIPLSIGLADLLEYAQLIDKGGASFSQDANTLTWTSVTIPSGAVLTRSFIIRLPPVIPSTATGQSDPSSYDCIMSSSFGETTRIPVACPPSKVVEQIASNLPSLSVQANLAFATILALIAIYFYARAKQLRTELRLIRHTYQGNL